MTGPHPYHVLQQLGLTKKEASLYLALLSKPHMAVAELARESNVKRATCYAHLTRLIQLGYVRKEHGGKRTYYDAADPNTLIETFRKRNQLLEGGLQEMASIRRQAIQIPDASVIVGDRAIEVVYESATAALGETRAILPSFSIDSIPSEEAESLIEQLSKTKAKVLTTGFRRAKAKDMSRKIGKDKVRTLPKWFTCNVEIVLYEETAAFIDRTNRSVVLLTSRAVTSALRSMFDMSWQVSIGHETVL